MGKDKTIHQVQKLFTWKNIHKEIAEYCNQCPICQLSKSAHTKQQGLLTLPHQSERPWADISLDLITCLSNTTSGYNSILVVVDRATKAVILIPTRIELDAEGFAQLMQDHVFSKHGVPLNILSDRDPRWTGKYWEAICKYLGINPSLTSAYHPESDGQTERANRTIEQVLRAHALQHGREWDKNLSMVEFAMNNSVHASLKYTPFFLNTGMNPLTPMMAEIVSEKQAKVSEHCPKAFQYVTNRIQTMNMAMENIKVARDRYKSYADSNRKDTVFQLGQEVVLSTANLNKHTLNRKLYPKFLGPFKITKVVNDVAYQIQLPDKWKIHDVFHVSLLKPWVANSRMQQPPPIPEVIEGELEYNVEKILADRAVKTSSKKNKDPAATSTARSKTTKREYYVQWEGYGMEHCTWEPETNLENAQDAIQDYLSTKQIVEEQSASRKANKAKAKAARTT